MKAVVLEDYAIQQGDLDWSGVKALVPDITRYGRTAQEEVVPRIGDAEIVFLNKCRIDEAVLAQCPKLRWVGIIATGTDNLDLKACRRHGVPVANVPGYSTYSVAQMTFSLLLAICQCADRYHRLVQDGQWRTEEPAAYGLLPQVELLGKTFGIYGYGSIGREAARIAKAKTQTDQQILDDIRNGIGRHRIRTKMTHNHGVHGETAAPNQLIAKHGQTILPKILLQRHIRMQHHRQPQTWAAIAAGYKHRPHQFDGSGNHRGNRRAENTQCG